MGKEKDWSEIMMVDIYEKNRPRKKSSSKSGKIAKDVQR